MKDWRPPERYTRSLPHEEIRALRVTMWVLEEEIDQLKNEVANLKSLRDQSGHHQITP